MRKKDAPYMVKAGRLVGATLEHISQFVKPGITTNEIDRIVHDFTLTHGGTPAPLNYKGFPKSVCTSVNDCLCHGVPNDAVLKDGDLINIDVTTILDGYYADASHTFKVGSTTEEAQRLCDIAKDARDKGIDVIQPGETTGTIGSVVENFVNSTPFHICKEIGGHGIGKVFHGEPFVPSYGVPGQGAKLTPWSCITVEPIVNQTSAKFVEVPIEGSDITYFLMQDGSLSAQFEHTILITDTGHEVLTLW